MIPDLERATSELVQGPQPGHRSELRLDVSVVLPCRDEGRTIAACVDQAAGWIARRGLRGEVVVVDNGSTDGSAAIARARGARLVREQRPGYGHALRAGFRAARGDVVVMADADATYALWDLDAFYDPIAHRGDADVVLGDRLTPGPSRAAMTLTHLVGNHVLSALTRMASGTRVTDVHCGLRSFSREAMASVPVGDGGMEFATRMVTHAHRSGLRVAQTPITLAPPAPGRRSHLRPVRDGLRHLHAVLGATSLRR